MSAPRRQDPNTALRPSSVRCSLHPVPLVKGRIHELVIGIVEHAGVSECKDSLLALVELISVMADAKTSEVGLSILRLFASFLLLELLWLCERRAPWRAS